MKIIDEENTYSVWKKSLRLVLEEGRMFEDEDGRTCKECLNLLMKIDSPQKDIKDPIDRLNDFEKWIYPSLSDIEKNIISKEPTLGYEYSYGERIFSYTGDGDNIDQVNDFLIPLLKENKNSRRAVLGIWNPLKDSNIFKKEIPGLVMLDFKVRSDNLNVSGIIRSNDLFYGWPASVYQCFKLQEFVSKKLGLNMGFLTTISTSAHIFEEQEEYIREVID